MATSGVLPGERPLGESVNEPRKTQVLGGGGGFGLQKPLDASSLPFEVKTEPAVTPVAVVTISIAANSPALSSGQ